MPENQCRHMENIRNEKVYAFDSLYTTNHIQMLKILLPSLNPSLQKNLALYIKFLEFRYTLSFVRAHPYVMEGCGFDKKPLDWKLLDNDLHPYLMPEEAEKIKQLRQSLDMIKQFENMQKNMEALKGILPEGMDFQTLFQGMNNTFSGSSDSDKTASPHPANTSEDMLKGMLSSSQMELYEKFNERFQNI